LRWRNDFRENATKLGPLNQAIIRPFQCDRYVFTESGCNVVHSQGRNETELGQFGRWSSAGKQKCGIKIAGLRLPLPPQTAPARFLFIRHNPNRPALSQFIEPACFSVGAVDCIVMEDLDGVVQINTMMLRHWLPAEPKARRRLRTKARMRLLHKSPNSPRRLSHQTFVLAHRNT
jgi:hypothetical protein